MARWWRRRHTERTTADESSSDVFPSVDVILADAEWRETVTVLASSIGWDVEDTAVTLEALRRLSVPPVHAVNQIIAASVFMTSAQVREITMALLNGEFSGPDDEMGLHTLSDGTTIVYQVLPHGDPTHPG